MKGKSNPNGKTVVTSISEALLIEIAARRVRLSVFPGVDIGDLQLVLSEADKNSYKALEKILWAQDKEWDSPEYKLSIVEAFASPLHSDASKEYFAAANMGVGSAIISACDQFLTEKIILSYIEGPRTKLFGVDCFTALMGSKHLSARIISAMLLKLYSSGDLPALEIIPDHMITPEVVNSWIKATSLGMGEPLLSYLCADAALRVKQAHPEYADHPDAWVVKIFCGE